MKSKFISFVAVAAVTLPAPALTASPAKHGGTHPSVVKAVPKPEPAICASLMASYDNASKKLALNKADDAVDDSAPRAAMRQSEDTATIAQAQATMQIMASNGCKAPTYAPSADRYGSSSMGCAMGKQRIQTQEAIDRLGDRVRSYDAPSECNTATWQPDKGF